MKPEVTSGSWEMLDAEGGRQVQFNVRTTGFWVYLDDGRSALPRGVSVKKVQFERC